MQLRRQTAQELENIKTVLRNAELLLGYIEMPGMDTSFGKKAGYNNQPWSGSFIDVLFHTSDVQIPSCVYPPSGLAEFIRTGAFYTRDPRVGDIVFLSSPTGHNLQFTMPHIGLCADTTAYNASAQVGTIEGNVSIGLAASKGHTQGVYRRMRSVHEIIGYGRPNYKTQTVRTVPASQPQISLDNIRAPRRNSDIGLVQRALAATVNLSLSHVTVDRWDRATVDAYAHWQRLLGYVGPDANGQVDMRSLAKLGSATQLFTVKT